MAEDKKTHEDDLDSSFMAVRRNSNFMSLLICFLITTNPDMGELSFLGFKFSAFNLPVVWAWIVALWLYFYWRYKQYYKEIGNDMIIKEQRKAEKDLFPPENCEFSIEGTELDQERLPMWSLKRNPMSAADINIYRDDCKDYLTGDGSFQVLGVGKDPNKFGATNVRVRIRPKDRIKWVLKARRKAMLERPALLTMNAPEYLFYSSSLIVVAKGVLMLVEAYCTIPPVFRH